MKIIKRIKKFKTQEQEADGKPEVFSLEQKSIEREEGVW